MSSGNTSGLMSAWPCGGIRYQALWVSIDCLGAPLHFSKARTCVINVIGVIRTVDFRVRVEG